MLLQSFIQTMRPAVEEELRRSMDLLTPGHDELRAMMTYHLGWEGEGAGPEAQGKRIRPILVLLSAQAAGGDWQQALPAAAAVELVHNFSLIHDDIEDQSPTRRGRPTVWSRWGVPHAINAGDTMFTLAHLELYQLRKTLSAETTFRAAQALDQTCLELTEGQYLDMSYEGRSDLTIQDYWPMVGGKTAALLGCCAELGAITAGADDGKREALRRFGRSLGLAFQVLDDWLGIWGDPGMTGKSVESDLVSRKKTLPVLYALGEQGRFQQRWSAGPIGAADVPELVELLDEVSAEDYTRLKADSLTREALTALEAAVDQDNQAAVALRELADMLLNRQY